MRVSENMLYVLIKIICYEILENKLFEEPIATSNIKLYIRIISFTESIWNISELLYFSRMNHLALYLDWTIDSGFAHAGIDTLFWSGWLSIESGVGHSTS